LPAVTGRAGKRLALISFPGGNQGSTGPSPCVDVLAALQIPRTIESFLTAAVFAYPTSNPDTSRTPPVEIKLAVLTATLTNYSLGKGHGFLIERRPTQRELSFDPLDVIEAWFQDSGITIGVVADTLERLEKAKRMLYTWKECFAKIVRDIQSTVLIEHSIDLEPHAPLSKISLPRYTPEEKEFANRIFLEMEDAGIIVRRSSSWGHRIKFPLKKMDSSLLRVVHNFIPVNSFTIKSGYSTHHLEDTLNVLIKPHFLVSWVRPDICQGVIM